MTLTQICFRLGISDIEAFKRAYVAYVNPTKNHNKIRTDLKRYWNQQKLPPYVVLWCNEKVRKLEGKGDER